MSKSGQRERPSEPKRPSKKKLRILAMVESGVSAADSR